MATHLALVSAQPMPTLISAFQYHPAKVFLLTSKEMENRAQWLTRVLAPKGIKTEIVPISPNDIREVRGKVAEVMSPGEDMVVNVTGGTKIMALGAFLEASNHKVPVFYVDTALGVIRNLNDNSVEPIQGKISIKEYLEAHGFQLTASKKLQNILYHKKAVGVLEKVLVNNPKLISSWNSLFSQRNSFLLEKKGIVSVKPAIHEAFAKLAEIGTGRFVEGRYFCNEETREYLTGSWLEEFVFHQVDSLKPDDLAMNVEVKWEVEGPGNTSNEFDILFTKNFRLFYVSCKTSLMEGKHGRSKGALYELDALRNRIAGLFGKAALVTMRTLAKEDYLRAQRMGITVVQGKDLRNIRSILAKWMQ